MPPIVAELVETVAVAPELEKAPRATSLVLDTFASWPIATPPVFVPVVLAEAW
jgi:hypothetical protein